MFGSDLDKPQEPELRAPGALPEGVIVSPDTRRDNRVPPGQSRTRRWPVLDASGPPKIELANWKLKVFGFVRQPVEWSREEFQKLPRVKVFSDFHCVTRWSRLGNVWEGVSTREIIERAGGLMQSAKWVAGIEFMDRDAAGFWERNGRGDPWKDERYGF